jgi:hypothetical protein
MVLTLDNEPVYATTDFMVTIQGKGTTEDKVRTVKTLHDLTPRTLELFCLLTTDDLDGYNAISW